MVLVSYFPVPLHYDNDQNFGDTYDYKHSIIKLQHT